MPGLIKAGLPCKNCGSSDAVAEYLEAFYCFSCQHRTRKTENPRKLWMSVPVVVQLDSHEMALPPNISYNLPKEFKAWLYQYHFCDTLIEKYKICYADPTFMEFAGTLRDCGRRCILPYYQDGELKFYDARSLDKISTVKYLSCGSKEMMFKSESVKENNEVLCIVEDSLSAMRVGETVPTVALRGTRASDKVLAQIMSLSNNFIVWLDSDEPGQRAAQKLSNKLAWAGKTVSIKTDKDPKCYSNDQIIKILD